MHGYGSSGTCARALPLPVRIRVTFTEECLLKDKRSSKRWVSIPSEVHTIGDFVKHLANLCKHEIQLELKLDDWMLSESESISILRETDVVVASVSTSADEFVSQGVGTKGEPTTHAKKGARNVVSTKSEPTTLKKSESTTRAKGDQVLSPPLAMDENAWRGQLKADDEIDACAVDNVWRKAVIKRIDRELPENLMVTIGFLSWSDAYDDVLPLDSARIAKPGTHTDWRSQLKPQSAVEVKKDGRWYEAIVQDVRADGELHVQAPSCGYSVWLSPESEMLSRPCTHINNQGSSIPSSSTTTSSTREIPVVEYDLERLLSQTFDHLQRDRSFSPRRGVE